MSPLYANDRVSEAIGVAMGLQSVIPIFARSFFAYFPCVSKCTIWQGVNFKSQEISEKTNVLESKLRVQE